MLWVPSLQDALASFDFLNKRNSMAVKPDQDGLLEQEMQHPDLELIAIPKDSEIRYRSCLFKPSSRFQIKKKEH